MGWLFPFPGRESHPLKAPGLSWRTEICSDVHTASGKTLQEIFGEAEIFLDEQPAQDRRGFRIGANVEGAAAVDRPLQVLNESDAGRAAFDVAAPILTGNELFGEG